MNTYAPGASRYSGSDENRARVIDGHVDLPIFVREAYANDVDKIDLEKQVSVR